MSHKDSLKCRYLTSVYFPVNSKGGSWAEEESSADGDDDEDDDPDAAQPTPFDAAGSVSFSRLDSWTLVISGVEGAQEDLLSLMTSTKTASSRRTGEKGSYD